MESDAQAINYAYYLTHIKHAKQLNEEIENSFFKDVLGSLAFLPVTFLINIAAYYKMKANNSSYRAAKTAATNYCYPPDEN